MASLNAVRMSPGSISDTLTRAVLGPWRGLCDRVDRRFRCGCAPESVRGPTASRQHDPAAAAFAWRARWRATGEDTEEVGLELRARIVERRRGAEDPDAGVADERRARNSRSTASAARTDSSLRTSSVAGGRDSHAGRPSPLEFRAPAGCGTAGAATRHPRGRLTAGRRQCGRRSGEQNGSRNSGRTSVHLVRARSHRGPAQAEPAVARPPAGPTLAGTPNPPCRRRRASPAAIFSRLAGASLRGDDIFPAVGDAWMEPFEGARMEALSVRDPGLHRYNETGSAALVDAIVRRCVRATSSTASAARSS